MSIRVLLCDDHQIVREGLRVLIEKQPDMEVIEEAQSGEEAVRLVRDLLPDVVVMDIAMPDLNGIEATRQILGKAPGVKVIALSMLLKDCAFEELANAIRAVAMNRVYLSPKIAEIVIKDCVRLSPQTGFSAFSLLSPREREVLQLLSEGNTTKEIAFRLRVSVKTIETYRKQIMDKLNMHSIAELTKFAIREGLTSLETPS